MMCKSCLDKPISIGDRTVIFHTFELRTSASGQTTNFIIDAEAAAPDAPKPPLQSSSLSTDLLQPQPPPPPPVSFAIIDANQQLTWSDMIPNRQAGSIDRVPVLPIKVVLSLPTKTREITVPLELKDLPIPK